MVNVYMVHWSDSTNNYGKPSMMYYGDEKLGLPFVYFTASDKEHAFRIVKELPNLSELHNIPLLYQTMENLRTHIFLGIFPRIPA